MPKSPSSMSQRAFTRLPIASGAAFYQSVLQKNASFKSFEKKYVEQGFRFIPERVHLIVGASSIAKAGIAPPYVLAVVPSFRKFKSDAPSHDAVSIVYLEEGGGFSVVAGHVTISHKPYHVQNFRFVTLDKGKFSEISIDANDLRGQTSRRLVAKKGATQTLSKDQTTLSGPLGADLSEIATEVYSSLLNDKYAKPLYPPAGLRTMSADADVVASFAAFSRAIFSPAGPVKQISGTCTSTSSSSNACSSTSSSVQL